MMRTPKRIIVWGAKALAGVIFTLLTAFALLQTPPVQRTLARALSRSLSAPGSGIRLEGLSGFVPFRFRLKSFSLSDEAGPWLLFQDLDIRLSAASLLRNRVDIRATASAFFPGPPALSARVRISAAGKLLAWEGRLEAEGTAPETEGLRIGSGFRFSETEIEFRNLSVVYPGLELEGALTLGLEDFFLRGRMEGDFRDISPLGAFLGADLAGSGRLRAQNLAGDAGDLLTFDLSMRDMRGAFGTLAGLQIRAEISEPFGDPAGTFSLKAEGYADGETSPVDFGFRARGRRRLDQAELAVEFRDVPLGLLAPAGIEGPDGLLDLDLAASGPVARPELEGFLSLSRLTLPGVAGEGELRARIESLQGLALVAGRLEGFEGSWVVFTARAEAGLSLEPFSLGFSPESPWGGELEFGLELASWTGLLDPESGRFSGRMEGKIEGGGTPAVPSGTGFIALEEGSCAVPAAGLVLAGVSFRAVLRERELILEDLRAGDGGKGRLTASGKVTLADDGFPAFAFRVVLRDFAAVRRDDLQLVLGADLVLTGSREGIRTEGKLETGPSRFSVPERFPGSIPDLEVVEVPSPPEKVSPPAPGAGYPVFLDLALEIPGRFFAQGRQFESEWAGSFRARGQLPSPAISGELRPLKGHFDFLTRRFEIREGALSLISAEPLVFGVFLLAEARAGEVTARIEVSGIFPDLKVALSSEPALPEDEVLARVLFGTSLDRITAFQAVKLALALNDLRQGPGGGGGIMAGTRDLLAVDRLELREAATSSGPATTLGVGKYLAEGVYLDLESGTASGTGKVRVELRLAERLYLESLLDDNLNNGVMLYWNYDY